MKVPEARTKKKRRYCKKALNVIVPDMGIKQSRMNPFNKHYHICTIPASNQNHTLFNSNKENLLNKRANTVRIKSLVFPRPDSTKVPMPCRSEVEDCWYRWITESESCQEEEMEKNEESKWQVRLTGEVIYNFTTLRTLALPTEEEVLNKLIELPYKSSNSSGKTLVLDLDETLVHAIGFSVDYSAVNIPHNKIHSIFYKNKEEPSFSVIKVIIRPYAFEFLEELSEIYEIVVILGISLGLHCISETLC